MLWTIFWVAVIGAPIIQAIVSGRREVMATSDQEGGK